MIEQQKTIIINNQINDLGIYVRNAYENAKHEFISEKLLSIIRDFAINPENYTYSELEKKKIHEYYDNDLPYLLTTSINRFFEYYFNEITPQSLLVVGHYLFSLEKSDDLFEDWLINKLTNDKSIFEKFKHITPELHTYIKNTNFEYLVVNELDVFMKDNPVTVTNKFNDDIIFNGIKFTGYEKLDANQYLITFVDNQKTQYLIVKDYVVTSVNTNSKLSIDTETVEFYEFIEKLIDSIQDV